METTVSMKRTVAIVGLGYVGLPLAVAFGKQQPIIGFDLKAERITELRSGQDSTDEVLPEDLAASNIDYTDNPADLGKADFIIVAVPTPIDSAKQPDLSCLTSASQMIGEHLSKGAIIVFESTVYPGVTEEVCVPVLEKASGLKYGADFKVGYSPERINPGDKEHTLERIVKIVSAMDAESLDIVAQVYETVCLAGVYRAPNIKTAEAAKVIENIQRDLNIALINELAVIFRRLGLDTLDVLKAAGTKWNFLPFRPGLVGGHCIGVDPYYLTHKAEAAGYHPQVILAGRRINDGMGKYLAEQTVKMMIHQELNVRQSRVAVLGITFKENVPDLRNSRVVDVIDELREYGVDVRVHDPLACSDEAEREYGIRLSSLDDLKGSDAVIIAVPHETYKTRGPDGVKALLRRPDRGIVVDVKSVFEPENFIQTSYYRL
jgi:UDP-N-acetyl-D-glucosamine/UDP-N-acetyl-D-galactosamine dehydrogenase